MLFRSPEVAVSAATRRPFASKLRVPRRVLAAASKDGEGKDTATKPTSSAQETTKETKDEKVVDVGVLAHLVKIVDQYLILIDSDVLYVLEKKTQQGRGLQRPQGVE